jgi:hypothetical protein
MNFLPQDVFVYLSISTKAVKVVQQCWSNEVYIYTIHGVVVFAPEALSLDHLINRQLQGGVGFVGLGPLEFIACSVMNSVRVSVWCSQSMKHRRSPAHACASGAGRI